MDNSLKPKLRMIQTQRMGINSSATANLFPDIDILINHASAFTHALTYTMGKKKMNIPGQREAYASMVDFLFCELHPEWITACRDFYNGIGPPLMELITPTQREEFERHLAVALEIAFELYQTRTRRIKVGWSWYRNVVLDKIKKLPELPSQV